MASKTLPLTIVQTLSKHREGDRIHKLLYWAVKGHWENEVSVLKQTSLQNLLQTLVEGAQTLDGLEQQLIQAASKLSKPERYKKVAGIVVHGCHSFYAAPSSESSDPAVGELEQHWIPEDDDAAPMTAVSNGDRFEVRQFLMQQIPPLKVKVLIFSLLHRPFTGQASDWAAVKAKSLDSWMAELIQTFPVRQELKAKLFNLAPQITELDQGLQAAEAILQATHLQML